MAIQDIQPEGLNPQQPTAPVEPAAAPTAPAQPEGPRIEALPPEVASLPAVQAVAIGQPPAISAKDPKDSPSVQAIVDAAPELSAAGLALFADKKIGVLFNPSIVPPEEIARAVKNGELDKIAVPIEMFEKAVADIMAEQEGGAAPGGAALPGPSAPPPSAKESQKVASARAKNVAPLPSTRGPKPGQGILNELAKPVI